MANGNGRTGLKDRIKETNDKLWNSQVVESILRPGSPVQVGLFRQPEKPVLRGDEQRAVSPPSGEGEATRRQTLLHPLSRWVELLPLHPADHHRHLLDVLLHPTAEIAYADIQALSTDVAFGSLVRNLHRWGAHLMVLSVFLHMSRVFYHGAYKPPREFNWVVGVILLLLTLLLSFSGYLLPWDQLALWAVTVGTNMAGFVPVIGGQVKFALLAGVEVSAATLLRFYVLHVLAFPFIIVIFMAVHFWRVRKDGGISGPL